MVTLSLRARRRMLWSLNALLIVALGAAVGFLGVRPIRTDGGQTGALHQPPDPAEGSSPQGHPLDDLNAYAVIHQRNLRQPLRKAPTAPTSSAPRPKLMLTLSGIVIEPGHSCAFLRTKTGDVRIVRQGDAVDGATVEAIQPDTVTLRFHGEAVVLKSAAGGTP